MKNTQDWIISKLAKLGNFSKGKGISKSEVKHTGFFCVRYGELYTDYKTKITTCNSFIDENSAKMSTKIKRGDILFAGSGETAEEIGASALFDIENGYAGGDIIVFRADKDIIDPEYLAYYLETFSVTKQKARLAQGHSVVHIYKNHLETIDVLYPKNIDEQKKIAQILSTWDEAIEAVEELIEKKKQFKKKLLSKTFDNLPQKKLLDVVNIIMGQSPSSDSYNELGSGLPFVGGNADIKENVTKPRFFTNQVTKIAKPNDIILTVRAPVGEVARNQIEICIGRGVCSLRPKLATDSSYIYQALKHKQKKWQALEQGSTFTAVNSNDIKKFSISWIDDPHSRSITAITLDQIDEEIELLAVKRKLLSKQKIGLMQRLLTGKVRVN